MTGSLYLLPSALGPQAPEAQIPAAALGKLLTLTHFIAEEARSARRFLAALGRDGIRDLHIEVLNEHTPAGTLDALLAPLRAGQDVGLLSEAGCPAVADPGADLVELAHAAGIPVVPMAGPSAILLTLMASGLGGQHFCFHGYLPVDSHHRQLALQAMERESGRVGATQLFIETPYRNMALLKDVLAHCEGDTLLCIGCDLTQPGESIRTRTIAAWRESVPDIDRRPAVFALRAGRRISASAGRRPATAGQRPPRSRQSGERGVRRSSGGA